MVYKLPTLVCPIHTAAAFFQTHPALGEQNEWMIFEATAETTTMTMENASPSPGPQPALLTQNPETNLGAKLHPQS